MVDVTIVNNSDQTAVVRLDENTDRGRDMVEHFKRMARRDEFKSVKVAESPTDEPAGADTDGDGVPEGSAAEVMAWVGDDRDRAVAAYNAEADKGETARKTLLTSLEKRAAELDKQ